MEAEIAQARERRSSLTYETQHPNGVEGMAPCVEVVIANLSSPVVPVLRL